MEDDMKTRTICQGLGGILWKVRNPPPSEVKVPKKGPLPQRGSEALQSPCFKKVTT